MSSSVHESIILVFTWKTLKQEKWWRLKSWEQGIRTIKIHFYFSQTPSVDLWDPILCDKVTIHVLLYSVRGSKPHTIKYIFSSGRS